MNSTQATLLGTDIFSAKKMSYLSVEDLCDMIKSPTDKVSSILNEIRNHDYIEDSDAILKLKQKLPGFMIQGKFKNGLAASDLVEGTCTNLLQLDYDNLSTKSIRDLKKSGIESNHVQLMFESPTKKGLKVFFLVDDNLFTLNQNDNLKKILKGKLLDKLVELNMFPKNVDGAPALDMSQLHGANKCFLSQDKDAFYNGEVEPLIFVREIKNDFFEKSSKHVLELISKLAPGKIQTNYEILIIGTHIGSDLKNGVIDVEYEKILDDLVEKKLKSISDKWESHLNTYKKGKVSGFKNPKKNFFSKITGDELLVSMLKNGLMEYEIDPDKMRDFIREVPFVFKGSNTKAGKTFCFKDHWVLPYQVGVSNPSTFLEKCVLPMLPDNVREIVLKNKQKFVSNKYFQEAIPVDFEYPKFRFEDVTVYDNCLIKDTPNGPVEIFTYEDYFKLTPDARNLYNQTGRILLDREVFSHQNYFERCPNFTNDGEHTFDKPDDFPLLKAKGLEQMLHGHGHDRTSNNEYVFNDDKYFYNLWHICKYSTTDRTVGGDERKKMLWIADENPGVDEGQVGKSLLARIITFTHQRATGPNRSDVSHNTEFMLSNVKTKVHTTLLCEDTLHDIGVFYPMITGDGASINNKFEDKRDLTFKECPNIICTSNVMPKNFWKDSNKARCETILLPNFWKQYPGKLGEECPIFTNWDEGDYNTLYNDLHRMRSYYMRNKKRPEFAYNPLETQELQYKMKGITSMFNVFVQKVAEYVKSMSKGKRETGIIKKTKLEDMYYGEFCPKMGIDSFSVDYIKKDEFLSTFRANYIEHHIEFRESRHELVFYFDAENAKPKKSLRKGFEGKNK